MANTILERIQERYTGRADDARNIAEAVGMVFGTGGRGAGAIVDVLYQDSILTFDANGGTGSMAPMTFAFGSRPMFPECAFTPPEGKTFSYWNLKADGSADNHYMPGARPNGGFSADAITLYAIWVDAE